VSDVVYEYRLLERHNRLDRGTGQFAGWTDWSDGSGYNNKNGGVYYNLSALKGQVTRSKRYFEKLGWPCEFKVQRREVNPGEWEEVDV
jgi:hypothetical protein